MKLLETVLNYPKNSDAINRLIGKQNNLAKAHNLRKALFKKQ